MRWTQSNHSDHHHSQIFPIPEQNNVQYLEQVTEITSQKKDSKAATIPKTIVIGKKDNRQFAKIIVQARYDLTRKSKCTCEYSNYDDCHNNQEIFEEKHQHHQ